MSDDNLDFSASLTLGDFVTDIDCAISLQGCTGLFGASGAGKSTLIRLIAGFLQPSRGRISYRGAVWYDRVAGVFTPAYKRGVGVVFQDARLFPHLTVEKNLLYADRRSDCSRYGFDEIADAFDLSSLFARLPSSLSGGERQRVALARTLLTRPDLLLLDEPLSALDAKRKAAILPYLDDLPKRFGAPVIYVSHNVDEIVRLASRTIILKHGRIEAEGATADVLNAHGDDAQGVIVTGVIAGHDDHYSLTRIDVGAGALALPINKNKTVGETVNLRIDARSVVLARSPLDGLSIRNHLPATIRAIATNDERASFVDVLLDAQGIALRAQVTREAADVLGLAPGGNVYALVKSASFDF
ncbi:MAG: molybdenum ABC transporter ATP-binding protein [Pseudomonadota bacterium]